MTEEPRLAHRIIQPQSVLEGAGVRLKRSIATRTLDYVDPFLLFDHFGSGNPDDYLAGFPMHPHRGIETVTYMLSGAVDHRDSLGNAGTIGPGDVQWMTAGGGIMHEEMPQHRQDRMEGFQLWVNLPARLKMTQPRYQEVASSQIPEIQREDGVRVRIIAGMAGGIRGAVGEIAADPTYLDVLVPAGGCFTQPIERGHAALAYVFEGSGTFGPASGDQAATSPSLITSPRLIFLTDGDHVTAAASETKPFRFLLISGKPLNESIARYGPFVMNTREEIEEALRDLRDGTFVR